MKFSKNVINKKLYSSMKKKRKDSDSQFFTSKIDQQPKLHLGFDAEPEIQILKVI